MLLGCIRKDTASSNTGKLIMINPAQSSIENVAEIFENIEIYPFSGYEFTSIGTIERGDHHDSLYFFTDSPYSGNIIILTNAGKYINHFNRREKIQTIIKN